MEEIREMLEKVSTVTENANVDLVFGKPEQVGDHILIPVAEVAYGYGLGMGSAEGLQAPAEEAEAPVEAEEQGEEKSGTASGAGGGVGVKARPLAYIEVGPEGTRVQSIMDEQKIALAGIMLAFWIFGWLGLVIKSIFKK